MGTAFGTTSFFFEVLTLHTVNHTAYHIAHFIAQHTTHHTSQHTSQHTAHGNAYHTVALSRQLTPSIGVIQSHTRHHHQSATMPAITFGNCPTRSSDGHFGAALRRVPSPWPLPPALLDDGYDADVDDSIVDSPLLGFPLAIVSRPSSPYAEMSPYAADPAPAYAVDFSGDVVVEIKERRVEFFVPARGSFSAPRDRHHSALERWPTPVPCAANRWMAADAWGRFPQPGVRCCLGKCVKRMVKRALARCGLKRDVKRGAEKL